MDLFNKHEGMLNSAIEALHARTFFAGFPEMPAPAVYGETADADGQKRFKARIGNKFDELLQDKPDEWVGQEESPYLQESLNITYPAFSAQTLIVRSRAAFHVWRKISHQQRAGILLESLERIKNRFFEITNETMHKTGQGFMM